MSHFSKTPRRTTLSARLIAHLNHHREVHFSRVCACLGIALLLNSVGLIVGSPSNGWSAAGKPLELLAVLVVVTEIFAALRFCDCGQESISREKRNKARPLLVLLGITFCGIPAACIGSEILQLEAETRIIAFALPTISAAAMLISLGRSLR
jgi:hypothetical protein